MRQTSDGLGERIEELKRRHPNSTAFIESELRDYLAEDGPPDNYEFYRLLRRRLEIDHPQPLKKRRFPGRPDPGRSARR